MIRSATAELRTFGSTAWDIVLPRSCVGCGEPGGDCCTRCAMTLPLAPDRPPPHGVDTAAGCLAHRGLAADLVARAKFHHGLALLERLGGGLAPLVAAVAADDAVITWAPTTTRHRRQRGFDQSEVLARAAAARLHPPVPVQAMLRRSNRTTQTGRRRVERLAGPQFIVAAPVPERVVVVDDVWTTGSTLSAAADALRRGGAHHVAAVVLAVRP